MPGQINLIMNTRIAVLACLLALNTSGCLAQTVVASDASQWHWTGVDRIVAFADVHGAYDELAGLLVAAGVVDDSLAWIAGDTHLVSVGDLLDRGARSRDVMDLLIRLQGEAEEAGGRVHVVAGNHELMNLIGDLRYVAREEFLAFAGDETGAQRDRALQNFLKDSGQVFDDETAGRSAFDTAFPPGFFAHRAAFAADGRYGRWLLSLPAVIAVNDTAFVHGGLPELVAATDPAELNKTFRTTVSRYLQLWRELIDAGALPNDQSKDASVLARSAVKNATESECVKERKENCEQVLASGGAASPEVVAALEEFVRLSDAPVLNSDGPLWYRGAIYCRNILESPILNAALANLNVKRVVVGHTTTPDARVRGIHDGKLIMLDTGMLVKHYRGRPAALLIENDKTSVQYLNPGERQPVLSAARAQAHGLTESELVATLQAGKITTVDKSGKEQPWTVQVAHNGNTIRALFYPRDRKRTDETELAAYTLNQLLGLDLVPPTVARELAGTAGALQMWYPDTVSETDRIAQGLNFAGWCPLGDQLQLMYAWDLLTANPGRSADNLLYRRKLWRVMLNQHGRAFSNDRNLPKSLRADAVTLAPGVVAALGRLDQQSLQSALGSWLDDKKIRGLLGRRDAMMKLFGNGG